MPYKRFLRGDLEGVLGGRLTDIVRERKELGAVKPVAKIIYKDTAHREKENF